MKRIEHILVLAPISLIVGVVGWVAYGTSLETKANNESAVSAGFSDHTEMTSAKKAGFVDATAYRSNLAVAEAAKQKVAALREAALAAEKVEADKLAEYKRDVSHRLEIQKTSWTNGGFGSVAVMTFTIKNLAEFPIRDISLSCSFSAPSGTTLGTASHTIFDTIKSKSTRTFKDVNVGFINSQASSSGCSITAAKRL